VQPGKIHPTFRRNISLPSLGYKKSMSDEPAWAGSYSATAPQPRRRNSSCHLHLHSWKVNKAWSAWCCFLLLLHLNPEDGDACSPETSVDFHRTTQRFISAVGTRLDCVLI
jgi:hypothetical protein